MNATWYEAIARSLLQAGMAAHTPVAVICRAHLPQQRQAVCTLATVPTTLADKDLVSPAVLVVGDVVRAAPQWQQLIDDDAACAAHQPDRTLMRIGVACQPWSCSAASSSGNS